MNTGARAKPTLRQHRLPHGSGAVIMSSKQAIWPKTLRVRVFGGLALLEADLGLVCSDDADRADVLEFVVVEDEVEQREDELHLLMVHQGPAAAAALLPAPLHIKERQRPQACLYPALVVWYVGCGTVLCLTDAHDRYMPAAMRPSHGFIIGPWRGGFAIGRHERSAGTAAVEAHARSAGTAAG